MHAEVGLFHLNFDRFCRKNLFGQKHLQKIIQIGGKSQPRILMLRKGAGLPDFSWYNIPKWEENIPKCPQNKPNGHKIFEMAVKCIDRSAIKFTNSFQCQTLQNLSKLGFLV
jgi:hypothetical protein